MRFNHDNVRDTNISAFCVSNWHSAWILQYNEESSEFIIITFCNNDWTCKRNQLFIESFRLCQFKRAKSEERIFETNHYYYSLIMSFNIFLYKIPTHVVVLVFVYTLDKEKWRIFLWTRTQLKLNECLLGMIRSSVTRNNCRQDKDIWELRTENKLKSK